MKTLIIPCAGKSSRFPNMKPKWMLTHPDGKLMIEKAIDGINTNLFNQIIITILQEHIEKYELSVPSLKEQLKISKRFSDLNNEYMKLHAEMRKLPELKQSILDKYIK